MDDIHGGQAVWIGACQILSAVFPGTSRSMSTIAADNWWECRAPPRSSFRSFSPCRP
jgi:undecaprenyl pyrophosphate phosphatase UppP